MFFCQTGIASADSKNQKQVKSVKKMTLDQAYQLTLDNLETLKINHQNILKVEAEYKEALSVIYPQIDLQIRDTYQNNQIGGVVNAQRKVDKTRFQAGFIVSQPIFTGFRESILAEAKEEEIQSLKFDDLRLKETLYRDVADIYLQIIYYQNDIEELKRNAKVLNDRIVELQEFVKLGKSRDSARFQSEADLQKVNTTIAQELTLLKSSQELLSYLVNIPISEFTLDDQENNFIKTSLDTYLAQAEERNDIRASFFRESSAMKQLKATEREGWPAINLDATYNPVDKPNREHSESLSLTMTMPIFDGGRIESRIEQRQNELESARLRAQQIKRETIRDVKVAFVNVTSTENEIKEHEKAVQIAQRALAEEKKDYAQGVVNNLEVLQAISTFHEAKRNLLRTKIALKQNQVNLLVAIGGVSK